MYEVWKEAIGSGWLLWNGIVFMLYGLDKRYAKKHRWRIPERNLLLYSVCGGAIGAWLGMHWFHHKTRHWKFGVGVPLCACWQVALLLYLYL